MSSVCMAFCVWFFAVGEGRRHWHDEASKSNIILCRVCRICDGTLTCEWYSRFLSKEVWNVNAACADCANVLVLWLQVTSCVHGSLYAMSERTWEIIRHKAKQLEIRLCSAWNTFLTKTSATANRRMGYPEDSKQNWKLCSWVTSALFVGATLMLSYLLVTVNYRYVVACKILCPNISETIINSPLVQVLKCSIFWKSRPKLGKTEYDCRIVDGCRWLCKDQNPKKALDAIALN